MNTALSGASLKSTNRQKGVSLVIALVFLLVITVLAIANLREVTLESRITGNLIENKQLLQVADAATRDGERRTVARGPQEPTDNCSNIATGKLCLLNRLPDYQIDMTDSQVYSPSDGTTMHGTAQWYSQPAPSGEADGSTENPEYGNMALGIGVFRYEVNGMASSNGNQAAVRTTVALNSKGLIEEK
ncbi:pilus assembly PilX family protein [Pseudomonas sp. BMS12]|uniref:pilus assembly PilX family protein n=1 Tax=Pseudomonas sp. BMS12 TaxID=1796033 RepID=UPI00083A260A|nr:PilX N-terminal domain-containing pilus assembly protein [Pseudomonas sp. BMS12]